MVAIPSSKRTFFYAIPEHLKVEIGQGVWVPFQRQILQGIVIDITEFPPEEPILEIVGVIQPEPFLSPIQIRLARWLSEYYLVPLFDALSLILPPGFERRIIIFLEPGKEGEAISKEEGAILRLVKRKGKVELKEIEKRWGKKRGKEAVLSLLRRGLLVQSRKLEKPKAKVKKEIDIHPPPSFPTPKEIPDSIKDALEKNLGKVFLLYGQNRKDIYLQTLLFALSQGKKGIMLVPRIDAGLKEFISLFPGRVALLHSRLSLRRRFDLWQQIKEGAYDLVIGSRSAIFAPQPNLGLIIIDEEHDRVYKQESPPYYHSRSVAVKMAEEGIVVILGSSTPDVESFYLSQTGRYELLKIDEKIKPLSVEVIDIKQELKEGNRNIISRALFSALSQALKEGGRAILFLNRRGTSTFVQCRDCGLVLLCKRCELPLTYHRAEDGLLCHHCGYKIKTPSLCPSCLSPEIKFFGIGTQKLEEEVSRSFQGAKIVRWDRDVIKRRGILPEADILVGTQLLTGVEIPSVALVGIVSADNALYLPDFRSGERTFQLLWRVMDKAKEGGKVIIQSYSPQHYAINSAGKRDYEAFFKEEIAYRFRHKYPPFSKLARLLYLHPNAQRCRLEAEALAKRIEEERDRRGIPLRIIGPSPAFISKERGRYRWQIILEGEGISRFLSSMSIPEGWAIDIDPIELL